MNLSLKCACQKLQGTINDLSPNLNQRFVCYCDDCQAYAHYLDRVKEVLDVNGGTEIVTCYPASIQITQGIDNLACVRLSDDGMFRWYASCCKTPIANTPTNPKIAYAGVPSTITDFSGLGPIVARNHGKYGHGTLPAGTSAGAPLRFVLRLLPFIFKGIFKKLHQPSPFFDASQKTKIEPVVLSDAEYYALINLCSRSTP